MKYRVTARRVYWRWLGEVELAGGPTLRMSGDAARWLRQGDEVNLRLRGGVGGGVLEGDEYALDCAGRVCWPLFSHEVRHVRSGRFAKELYGYDLRIREASAEKDYEAMASLESYNFTRSQRAASCWRCPDGSLLRADEKPRCQGSWGRLLELAGSTPASRFLLLEILGKSGAKPVAYLRLDPPLPVMYRRLAGGVSAGIREAVFPKDWFGPTLDPKALQPRGRSRGESIQEMLDGMSVAAARIGRLLVHPKFRSEGLGLRLLRSAVAWVQERAVSDGRRDKQILTVVAEVARLHPVFEKAGFRYLWDTASGKPLLAYPLGREAESLTKRFLQSDPYAIEHGGRLFRSRYRPVSRMKESLHFSNVDKTLASEITADALVAEVRRVLGVFGAAQPRLERALLRNVKLRIEPGGVTLLRGSDEAAKTAILRLLWDELPDSGWVDTPPGRVEAYLPGVAEPALGDEPILQRAARRLKDSAAAVEVLCRMGLADAMLWRMAAEQLSAGDQERFRLALMLAARPQLLLLGDFAAHLSDAAARRLARSLAFFARQAGITLVVSSKRKGAWLGLEPDKVIHVNHGAIRTEKTRR